ncbi:peptidoglycan recognition family protein [Planctomyces sp. SH-PL62]|uniref:peptidoglycan recognition protein family protein n=1 Tax=Planctomyces sp. SH-PL62 TaxID=1636152 RepID=UPI00078E565F|nr:peptidoglycan recognition family protein [Planctomyces sp. SH-PL62]AMV37810.1 N-acetylmuramoyl-L-alanine amidase [Planctomyces sp. SH-PL62]
MRAPIVVTVLAGLILGADSPGPKSTASPRPEIVSASEWGSKPQPIPESRKHTPKYVTLHHAGVIWTAKVSPDVFVRNMQSWGQREKGWPDLPYHFLIAPDGRIFEGRPLGFEPESNTKYPLQGNIGVEMMGSFEAQRPDPRQVASCVKLTAWLCDQYDIDLSRVRGHRDAASGQTTCPGKDFERYLKDGQFPRWVRETLDGETPAIDLGPPLPDGPTDLIPATAPKE